MTRVIAWFAHNPVAANLLMFLCVAGGLAAIPMIQQKTFPDMTVEIVQISVPYLGAAPEEVEEGVCVRIEEEVHGLDGIERISSSAAEGRCGVTRRADRRVLDRSRSRGHQECGRWDHHLPGRDREAGDQPLFDPAQRLAACGLRSRR